MRSLKLFFLLAFSIQTQMVGAADFRFSELGGGYYQIELHGEIQAGEADDLMALITGNPGLLLATSTMMLSSPGGSVAEALQIAEIVEQASWMTVVHEPDTCASACFLIFVAASERASVGRILVHRPYLDSNSYDQIGLAQTTETHRTSMLNVRRFLEEQFVPGNLIDRMTYVASTEAYELNAVDYISLGMMSPTFEEAAIAKCGLSNMALVTQQYSSEHIACTNRLRTVARAQLLRAIVGEAEVRSALREWFGEDFAAAATAQWDQSPPATPAVQSPPRAPADSTTNIFDQFDD